MFGYGVREGRMWICACRHTPHMDMDVLISGAHADIYLVHHMYMSN